MRPRHTERTRPPADTGTRRNCSDGCRVTARNRQCALHRHAVLTLDERGDRDNIVHRAAEILCAGLDVRVILVAEVVEHLVDGIDNRSVALYTS